MSSILFRSATWRTHGLTEMPYLEVGWDKHDGCYVRFALSWMVGSVMHTSDERIKRVDSKEEALSHFEKRLDHYTIRYPPVGEIDHYRTPYLEEP